MFQVIAMFEELKGFLNDLAGGHSERSRSLARVEEGLANIMAKFDKLEADLADLEAAVAALQVPVVEDDSAEVSALEARVEKLTEDVKGKVPTSPAVAS